MTITYWSNHQYKIILITTYIFQFFINFGQCQLPLQLFTFVSVFYHPITFLGLLLLLKLLEMKGKLKVKLEYQKRLLQIFYLIGLNQFFFYFFLFFFFLLFVNLQILSVLIMFLFAVMQKLILLLILMMFNLQLIKEGLFLKLMSMVNFLTFAKVKLKEMNLLICSMMKYSLLTRIDLYWVELKWINFYQGLLRGIDFYWVLMYFYFVLSRMTMGYYYF